MKQVNRNTKSKRFKKNIYKKMFIKNYLIISLFLSCLQLLSFKHLFLLRNIFVIYTFAIYNIAPLILSTNLREDYSWSLEFIAVLALFMMGYYMGLKWVNKQKIIRFSATIINSNRKESVLKFFIISLILTSLAVNFINILSFGVVEFYRGAALEASIKNYGKADLQGAVFQVITFALSTLIIVSLAVFIERVSTQNQDASYPVKNTAKSKLANRLSFIWLVIFPIIQLSRSTLIFGAITYLAIRSKLKKSLLMGNIIFIVLGGLALGLFIYAGLSRAQAMGQNLPVQSLFISELSPFIAYREIKENIDVLQYQYGYRLFLPFLLKIIPRGVFPDKIQNSGGYFMETIHPEEFQAGFALAPTYMGSLYINFGLFGVLVGTWLMGVFSGRIDGIVIYKLKDIGLFLIVLSVYPLLLRNDLSSMMFDLSIKIAAYFIFKKLFSLKLAHLYKSIALILRQQ